MKILLRAVEAICLEKTARVPASLANPLVFLLSATFDQVPPQLYPRPQTSLPCRKLMCAASGVALLRREFQKLAEAVTRAVPPGEPESPSETLRVCRAPPFSVAGLAIL